jgi:hypothetical protein
MKTFCFTGKGHKNGKPYDRKWWSADARACGFEIHDKVHPHTDYLVASRSDTTKAAAARANGTTVISYAQFEQLLENGWKNVSRQQEQELAADRVADKRAAHAAHAAALEEAAGTIEGWGTF